jgi:hypothetical protein
MVVVSDTGESKWTAERVIPSILVAVVIVSVLAPLYFLAGTLVVRSGLLDYHGGNLDPKQFSAVWALIGALFASGVSLLGLLATYLHQRRTHQLAEQAEKRLQLDSVVRGLELLTEGNGYASKAAVSGGLATVVRLGQASIALTALRTAWKDGAVDPGMACWLTDRVIESGSSADITVASTTLLEHSDQLAYMSQTNHVIIILPDSIEDNWDEGWPTVAKTSFIGALAGAQMAVPPEAWMNGNPVLLRSLLKATYDSDAYIATTAAKVLRAFAPTVEELAPIFGTDRDSSRSKAGEEDPKLTTKANGADFFPRIISFVEEIELWRRSGTRRPARRQGFLSRILLPPRA